MSASKQIWLFLAVTFGWSWLFWWPATLVGKELLPSGELTRFLAGGFNPAPWGPLVGAFVVATMHGGLRGAGRLLARGIRLRFAPIWYLVIFVMFPVLVGGALLFSALAGGTAPAMPALAQPATLPIAFVFILLLGGPLQEEFGWRGTLLDPLQERFGALAASVAVGFVWGIWHLPLFFIPAQDGIYYQRPVWGLILTTTLISVLFTWIYNNTGKSIAAMLLLHTVFNFSHFVFPTLESDTAGLALFAAQFVVAALVVVIWGPNALSRSPNVSANTSKDRR